MESGPSFGVPLLGLIRPRSVNRIGPVFPGVFPRSRDYGAVAEPVIRLESPRPPPPAVRRPRLPTPRPDAGGLPRLATVQSLGGQRSRRARADPTKTPRGRRHACAASRALQANGKPFAGPIDGEAEHRLWPVGKHPIIHHLFSQAFGVNHQLRVGANQ